MPFKIIRNDITKMNTEAIVNTANDQVDVGTGCDFAIYKAAGYDKLLTYRKQKIGVVPEGEVFITPGFDLRAKYIIHAVSPVYIDGNHGEEEKLRSCYRKGLALAKNNGIKSIAFPLISTGSFGYPKEEGMRIAVDEIKAFLLTNQMDIILVVFDTPSTKLGAHIYPELKAYIDQNYVIKRRKEEYVDIFDSYCIREKETAFEACEEEPELDVYKGKSEPKLNVCKIKSEPEPDVYSGETENYVCACDSSHAEWEDEEALVQLEGKLRERLTHMSDTFSEYLLYLIHSKGMENADVYKRAIVDKKTFSKIKSNPDYHPQKITALCLCVGARLNLDETKDLLARAGYALSPCDMTDIIFSFFIEHKHFDIIDIDIQLEEHGLPCIIS